MLTDGPAGNAKTASLLNVTTFTEILYQRHACFEHDRYKNPQPNWICEAPDIKGLKKKTKKTFAASYD